MKVFIINKETDTGDEVCDSCCMCKVNKECGLKYLTIYNKESSNKIIVVNHLEVKSKEKTKASMLVGQVRSEDKQTDFGYIGETMGIKSYVADCPLISPIEISTEHIINDLEFIDLLQEYFLILIPGGALTIKFACDIKKVEFFLSYGVDII